MDRFSRCDPEDVRRVKVLALRLQKIGQAEEGPFFMGFPDRWFSNVRFRCPNDHVSSRVLGCDDDGPRDRCLACGAPTTITFPEDQDGPLPEE